jgi:hypothetical protein
MGERAKCLTRRGPRSRSAQHQRGLDAYLAAVACRQLEGRWSQHLRPARSMGTASTRPPQELHAKTTICMPPTTNKHSSCVL